MQSARPQEDKPQQADQAESWEAAISAWVDGEGEDELPAMLASPQGRKVWDTYHLIGDALRSSELAVRPSDDFHARLARALEAELPIVAAPARRRTRLGLSAGLTAVAVVAAAAVWMGLPLSDGGATGGDASPSVLADAGSSVGLEEAGLRDYLDAHRQMAGPIAVRQVSFDVGMGR